MPFVFSYNENALKKSKSLTFFENIQYFKVMIRLGIKKYQILFFLLFRKLLIEIGRKKRPGIIPYGIKIFWSFNINCFFK